MYNREKIFSHVTRADISKEGSVMCAVLEMELSDMIIEFNCTGDKEVLTSKFELRSVVIDNTTSEVVGIKDGSAYYDEIKTKYGTLKASVVIDTSGRIFLFDKKSNNYVYDSRMSDRSHVGLIIEQLQT